MFGRSNTPVGLKTTLVALLDVSARSFLLLVFAEVGGIDFSCGVNAVAADMSTMSRARNLNASNVVRHELL